MSRYTNITTAQKLTAISLKYYDHFAWTPKKGDYYTSVRDDLELYKIVKETKSHLYTIYCNRECEPEKWDKKDFLNDFGIYRVYVPIFLLEDEKVNKKE